ncbi:MAG: ABC transporter ATP-binding protein [Oscillospiraceae bacterium]|nr:ABC transporter ATP-binding protein [Oscillospiraceae bacterium]
MLEVKNLTVQYGALTIVDNISFSLHENRWLVVVGPNGSGKSSMIKAIVQNVPYTGDVLYKGQDVSRMKPAVLAQKIGALSQTNAVAYSFTAGEIVRMGRYSYSQGIFKRASGKDRESVQKALEMTGMLALENQSVLTLSGGELQRAFLAQALAQDPNILILDEPTNHLDLVYQKQVFEQVRKWVKQPGRAVISVVHDLSLARAYGTDVMLLSHGRIVSAGDAETVLSRRNLQDVYSMDVHAWMRKILSQWES